MSLSEYIIPGILLFSLLSCNSPSDKIAEQFKKIDEQLQRSDDSIDSITQKMKIVGFDQSTADSLTGILNGASVYFQNIKAELENMDRKGEKLDAAEKLLIKTPKGDSLFNHLMSVYDLGIKYSADSIRRQEFILLKMNDKDKWLEKHFKKIPTFAAKTMVSKFGNDCSTVRMIVASAGIRELKNKIISE